MRFESTEIIRELVELAEKAIERGDWKVDGSCDPGAALFRADEYMRSRGWVRDGLTGTEYVRD